MTLRRRKWAGLAAALIVCFTLPSAQAAEDGETTAPVTYSYRYELEADGSAAKTAAKSFALYVRGTASDGSAAPPLHTGSIALNAVRFRFAEGESNWLSFTPESWVQTLSLAGAGGAAVNTDKVKHTVCEIGEPVGTDGKGSYLGFTWSAVPNTEIAAVQEPDGRYKLGVLSSQLSGLTVQGITLLPWTQTQTGAAFYSELSQENADVEALQELIGSAWRIADKDPYAGYFQGYYVVDDEAGQAATDIGCSWQSLVVLSYAPQRPVTLEAVFGGFKAYAEIPGAKNGTGFATAAVKFEELTFHDSEGKAVTLPNGTYRLTLRKQSHLPVVLTGLTVSGNAIFPELLGDSVYLPCGDVAPRRNAEGEITYGDYSIDMADRAALMACLGSARPGKQIFVDELAHYADLDGDGAVTMGDLSILMAPRNYGARFTE